MRKSKPAYVYEKRRNRRMKLKPKKLEMRRALSRMVALYGEKGKRDAT